ncbi:MAG: undecaprenyl-phosphate glucose phosphotransferase [Phycisphaerales bacterium]|nr:undecaprenyl-phosphate glucose phosphotransferase [Phycisphaerales bacterium]
MLRQRHNLFVSLFGVLDAVAIASASLLAWGIRLNRFDQPIPTRWEEFFKDSLMLFAIPIAIVTMLFFKLYKPRRDRALVGELGQVFKASFVSVMMIVVALWAIGSSRINTVGPPSEEFLGWRLATDPLRFQLAILAAALPVSIGSFRLFLRLILRSMRRRGWNMRHVAIIGVGRFGQITARTLARNSWTGIRVEYFISHHEQTARTRCLTLPVVGGVNELESILESRPVDAVYLAIPSAMSAQLPNILRRLEKFAIDVRIVPDIHPRYLPQNMAVSELEGMPILSYRESPMAGIGGIFKRGLDVIGAILGMLIFSPVMIAIAIGIRLSSPGPIFFRQRRVSLGGDVFDIWKFRTMHLDDDSENGQPSPLDSEAWTSKDDPRITRIGYWLRKTSLDELPQLFNVLLGDMALVGPRPERPELIDRFREDWRGYMLRQQVKAGMTGWAQVNGLRGDTSLRKRLQYDLFYIRNWTIWFDIRILVLTIFRGFIHRNAY